MFTLIVLVSTLMIAPLMVRVLNDLHRKSGREGHSKHGGIIVLLGMSIGAAYWVLNTGPIFLAETKEFMPVIFTMAGFALIGWLADEFNFKHSGEGKRFDWIMKLTLQAIVTAAACWGAGFDFGTSLLIILVTLFMANAASMIDGFEMLAPVVLCVILTLWELTAGHVSSLDKLSGVWDYSIESTLLIAVFPALLVFLLWNAAPAKVSLGGVGKMPLGALLGWSVGRITAGVSGAPWPDNGLALLSIVIFFLPILALALPPILQALSLRFFEKPMFRFRTPFPLALLDAGWSKARILMLIMVAQVLCHYIVLETVVLRESSR
jgi:UDP-N-acetylmuramyl pentapeptide phosphotransferase/UDP-N-acetylglucosamine-1-phosphate transferase